MQQSTRVKQAAKQCNDAFASWAAVAAGFKVTIKPPKVSYEGRGGWTIDGRNYRGMTTEQVIASFIDCANHWRKLAAEADR